MEGTGATGVEFDLRITQLAFVFASIVNILYLHCHF